MKPQKPKKRSTNIRRYATLFSVLLATVAAIVWNLLREGDYPVYAAPLDRGISAKKERTKRFVTVILFSPVNPEERPQRIRAIEETWGRPANAIYVVPNSSNSTDYAVDGILPLVINANQDDDNKNNLDFLFSGRPLLLVLPPGMTNSDLILQFSIATIHQLIFKESLADFVLVVNDHTLVLPDNVCRYLESKDPSQPLHAGHALVGQAKFPFNSNAIGFVLSRATVLQLITAFETGPSPHGLCQNYKRHFLTECLVQNYNLSLANTRDAEGRHRFHGYGIARTLEGKQDGWYIDFHKDPQNLLGFSSDYATVHKGRECCSSETTTFHYVQQAETRALSAIRTALRAHPRLVDAELQQLVVEKWPTSHKALGGYASPLPPTTNNTQLWDDLLHVIRLITPETAYVHGC